MITKGGIKLFGVAGSGKTTTCLNIISYLCGLENNLDIKLKNDLDSFGIDNTNITDIGFTSFTKASIISLLEKLENNNIFLPKQNYIRTLNSITWRLAGFDNNNQMKLKETKDFFDSIHISTKRKDDEEGEKSEYEYIKDVYSALLNTFAKRLKNINNEEIETYLVDVYSLKTNVLDSMSVETIISALRKYDKWKIENNKYDYVDSFIYVIENKIDIPVRVLVVDEAQDLSYIQTQIIDLWVKEFNKEIFIIAGDDDQTVYEWNGAKPDYLIEFNYNGIKKHFLERSYRLPSNIANMCNDILGKINYRALKKIYSLKKEGEIVYMPLFNMFNLPKLLQKFYESGETNKLLFRTNNIKKEISDYLFENSNIVFGMIGNNENGRWNKKFLSICNALNKISKNKNLNKEEIVYLLSVLPSRLCLEYGVKSKASKLSELKEYPTSLFLNMTRLWKQQRDLLSFDKDIDNSKIKDQIIKFIKYFTFNEDNIRAIKKNELYQNKFRKINNIINFKEKGKKVEFSTLLGTFHSAKGLEADNIFVFLGTCNYFQDINDSEKRCFYVASSRPKERIFFIGSMNGQKTFLEEEFREIIRKYRTN